MIQQPAYIVFLTKVASLSSSGSLLCGARRSDWRSDDEEGFYRRQVCRQRGRAQEDGGGGQSSWTHPFLCKKKKRINIHPSNYRHTHTATPPASDILNLSIELRTSVTGLLLLLM